MSEAKTIPKPVELTEAEMNSIIKGFFPLDHSCAHNVGPVFDIIETIIGARETGARVEAWDAAVQRVRECHAECADECDLCIARDEVLSDLRTNPYRAEEQGA